MHLLWFISAGYRLKPAKEYRSELAKKKKRYREPYAIFQLSGLVGLYRQCLVLSANSVTACVE